MKYYSALKRNDIDIRTHARGWMNPEDFILSEMNQTQKAKYCIILLI